MMTFFTTYDAVIEAVYDTSAYSVNIWNQNAVSTVSRFLDFQENVY